MKKAQKLETPKKQVVVKIESLTQLQKIIDAPMECVVLINEDRVAIPVNRLSPELEDQVQVVRNSPVPPLIKPTRPGEEEHYNDEDPEYKKQVDIAAKKARALTVYYGCPSVRNGKPDLKTTDDIYKYVQGGNGNKGILTNMILELLNLKIMGEGLAVDDQKVMAKANFTTAPE